MPEKFSQLKPEKQEVIVRHPEPIKIPKRFTEAKAAAQKGEPRSAPEREKNVLDKIWDSLKDPERYFNKKDLDIAEAFLKEPATKTIKVVGKGLRKSSEVLIEKPTKKVFSGVWKGFTNLFKKKTPEKIEMPKSTPQMVEKDKIDKVLDVMEEVEKKIMEEGLWKSLGGGLKKGLSKGAEVFIKRPLGTIFSGKTNKQSSEEYEKAEFEKIEMPQGSTLETEDENILDLSLPGVTKKELGEEVTKIENQGLSEQEKEAIALSRLKKNKK